MNKRFSYSAQDPNYKSAYVEGSSISKRIVEFILYNIRQRVYKEIPVWSIRRCMEGSLAGSVNRDFTNVDNLNTYWS